MNIHFRNHTQYLVTLLTLGLCAVIANSALASGIKRDLLYAFNNTEAVVEATILKVEMFAWAFSPIQEDCGHKVRLKINKSYSGSYKGELDIGSSSPLVTGQRYLLFLNRSDKFKSLDRWPEEIEKLIDACSSNIPLIKSNWGFSSKIGGWGQNFLVFAPLLSPPDELQEFTDVIESNWIVSGESLDYEKFNNSVSPTIEEQDKFSEMVFKASSVCRQLEFPCRKTTIMPFKKLDEWLERQSIEKANKTLNTDASEAGAG